MTTSRSWHCATTIGRSCSRNNGSPAQCASGPSRSSPFACQRYSISAQIPSSVRTLPRSPTTIGLSITSTCWCQHRPISANSCRRSGIIRSARRRPASISTTCSADCRRGRTRNSAGPTQLRGTKRKETTMATETTTKATLGRRAVHEFKELAILTAYLYVTLGAVILMKAAVLHGAGVSFTPWGIAIVKAFVLAKFMLIGRAIKIGERYTTQPLIWPTLHKSFAFLVLLIVLTIIEEVVVGLFHQQSVVASLGELTGAKLYETLAGYIIMLLVLIPYIAWGA